MRLFISALICSTAFSVYSASAQDTTESLEENLNAQVTALTEQVKAEGPKFMLSGPLEAGVKSKYSVNGEDFDTDVEMEVFGVDSLSLGQNVQASGLIVDGKKIATKVVVQERPTPAMRSNEAPLRAVDLAEQTKLHEPGPVVPMPEEAAKKEPKGKALIR